MLPPSDEMHILTELKSDVKQWLTQLWRGHNEYFLWVDASICQLNSPFILGIIALLVGTTESGRKMAKEGFIQYLNQNVALFDGAMGTMLYNRGFFLNRCFDELNLSNGKAVQEIHSEYLQAGADCIETNTFGANRFKLSAHGFGDKLVEINFEGARIARKVAGNDAWVVGSIGPLGIKMAPLGNVGEQEAREAFREQAQALRDGGVDLFILETFTDLRSLHQGILAVRDVCQLPIIASVTIGEEGNSLYGTSPENIARFLQKWGADVVGLNCSVGPRVMLEALERIVTITHQPISILPNAGYPQAIEGRNLYLASPEYMAEYARRFVQTGAKVVGGCCGTTPDHIKEMRAMLRSLTPQQRKPTVTIPKEDIPRVEQIPMVQKSKLGQKIGNGEFLRMVEVVPPRGWDAAKILQSVSRLKDAGVDAINVPDGPRALSRMSAQHLSVLIDREVGIEPVLHYTCRDRNLLGMMSDMLGLYAVGIRNLLIITGDPPKMGDYPDATAVFDVDSIGLINLVHQLNKGYDLGGNPLGKPTGYLVGVGVNPGAVDLDREIERFAQKVDAGAEYAITQPVFDPQQLIQFLEKIAPFSLPVVAGLWPLVSVRNAEFMNNEVPGASVPETIMQRMRRTRSKEEALREGLKISTEILDTIKPHIQGVQVSAPFGRVEYAIQVLSQDPVK